MSRGFGSTFGVNSADNISPRYAIGQGSRISIAGWYYKNGSSSIFQFAQFSSGASGIALRSNSATQSQYFEGGSGGNNSWTYNDLGQGKWQHICITDTLTVGVNPIIYVNGSIVSISGSSTNTPVANTSQFWIGSFNGVSDAYDGMMAHWAYWNGTILTAAEAMALANGVNPLGIRPEGLSFYLPLDGINNPEPDFILGTCSISGTKRGTSDPPVSTYDILTFNNSYPTPTILPNGVYARGLMYNGGGALPQYSYGYAGGAGVIDWGYNYFSSSISPPEGSILIHHKRRGQPGSVMRGTGLAGGGGLVQ